MPGFPRPRWRGQGSRTPGRPLTQLGTRGSRACDGQPRESESESSFGIKPPKPERTWARGSNVRALRDSQVGREAPGQLGLQGAPSRGLASTLGAPARGLGGPCPGCGSRAGASGGRGRRERRGTRGEVRARRGVAVTAGNVGRMPAATVTAVAPSLPCHCRRPHSRGSPRPLLCARPTPPSAESGWPGQAGPGVLNASMT